jgi:RNA ligase (TIGR02306 family)
MSYFAAEVIDLPTPVDHPNADSLYLFNLKKPFEVTVIGNKESWKGKSKAVYVMNESVVDTSRPEFSFLGKHNKVKAKKLRGILSQGLLVPAKDEWPIGYNAAEDLGITKYEEPVESLSTFSNSSKSPSGDVKYTDIENIRRYPDTFQLGESVVLTEKIHGANARYVYQNGEVFMGSRTRWVKDEGNIWSRAFHQSPLSKVIDNLPNCIFFGEVFGQVQDLKYGRDLDLHFFDIYDIRLGKYYDWNYLTQILGEFNLTGVPLLYRGDWLGLDKMLPLAEGKSLLADHTKEGWVARPICEEWSPVLGGRKIVKGIGTDYLLRKEK